MKVVEIFRSVQGEGPWLGSSAVFVRFAGCSAKCPWCLDEDSLVLMANFSEKRLGELVVGDWVIGVERGLQKMRFVPTKVRAVSKSHKECVELTSDSGSVVLTPDHKLWKLGRGKWAEAENLVDNRVVFLERATYMTEKYYAGYLAGAADGDGCFWTLKPKGTRRFRLATNDVEILERFAEGLDTLGIRYHWGWHTAVGFSREVRRMPAILVTRHAEAEELELLVKSDWLDSLRWRLGYMAGLFDTDGKSGGTLRWTQYKVRVKERLLNVLRRHGWRFQAELGGVRLLTEGEPLVRKVVQLRPAVLRKAYKLVRSADRCDANVESIASVGVRTVVTVTTTVGSYIANGFVVKNCDTKSAWSKRKAEVLTPREIVARVLELDPDPPVVEAEVEVPGETLPVVLTGGEPLEQDVAEFAVLVDILRGTISSAQRDIVVETNGKVPLLRVDKKGQLRVTSYGDMLWETGSRGRGIFLVLSPKVDWFPWGEQVYLNLKHEAVVALKLVVSTGQVHLALSIFEEVRKRGIFVPLYLQPLYPGESQLVWTRRDRHLEDVRRICGMLHRAADRGRHIAKEVTVRPQLHKLIGAR